MPGEGDAGGSAADAAQMLEMLDAERDRAIRALVPDPRLLYGVWGMAWLVGFVALWFATGDTGGPDVPTPLAATLFGACQVGAVALTIVHIARRSAGVRGHSSRIGAMYGWAWGLAFLTLFAVMSGAYEAGISKDLASTLWPVLSGLIVGTLYLAGGAIWNDMLQYRLGVVILLASAGGALAGYPAVYLVMGLGGGGGFLAAATYYAVRRRESPR